MKDQYGRPKIVDVLADLAVKDAVRLVNERIKKIMFEEYNASKYIYAPIGRKRDFSQKKPKIRREPRWV